MREEIFKLLEELDGLDSEASMAIRLDIQRGAPLSEQLEELLTAMVGVRRRERHHE